MTPIHIPSELADNPSVSSTAAIMWGVLDREAYPADCLEMTDAEIADLLGRKVSTVRRCLTMLEDTGFLSRSGGHGRGRRITLIHP